MIEAKSRGLWVGLPIPSNILEYRGRHPLTGRLRPDSHITLAHLGKTNNENMISNVRNALLRGLDKHFPLDAEITGTGTFWRKYADVHFALVNSAGLFDLRSEVTTRLFAAGIEYDRRFGFIPHITMDSQIPSSDNRPWAVQFQFTHVELVWGDNRMVL